jgi:hypothetical protein
MKLKLFISTVGAFIISACSHYGDSQFKDTDFKTANITSSIISDSEGFGYEIWVNGKKYIHQRYIPSVKPYKRFSSADDAQKVADLVIKKLREEIIPPKISVSEIEKLGIN